MRLTWNTDGRAGKQRPGVGAPTPLAPPHQASAPPSTPSRCLGSDAAASGSSGRRRSCSHLEAPARSLTWVQRDPPAAGVLGRSALAPAGRRSSWEARELLSDGPPGVLDGTGSSPAHFHQLEAKCGPELILAGYQIAAHVDPLTSAHTHPGTSVSVRTFTTTTQRQSSRPQPPQRPLTPQPSLKPQTGQ